MAMVIITIQDRPDNVTEVRLDAEPAPTAENGTTAHRVAAAALAAISKLLSEEAPKIILPTTRIAH